MDPFIRSLSGTDSWNAQSQSQSGKKDNKKNTVNASKWSEVVLWTETFVSKIVCMGTFV